MAYRPKPSGTATVVDPYYPLWGIGWAGLIIGGIILIISFVTVVKVFNLGPQQCSVIVDSAATGSTDSAKDAPQNGVGMACRGKDCENRRKCTNCLKPIIEEGFGDIEDTLDQYLVFGQGTCNKQEGIYDVQQYFGVLLPPYEAIRRFDNVRTPTNYTDPTRTNITYYPGVPLVQPGGPYSNAALGNTNPPFVGNLIDHSVFKKFQSVPQSIGFFLNVSFLDIPPTDERLTVFLKNVEDRGPGNLEHRRYMAALTKSKVVGRYANRIRVFVDNLYNSWVISRLPILSTFKDRLIDFFLDIHLGTADHPPFVKDYFSDFLIFISVTDSNADAAVRIMKGHMNSKCVREYVRSRIAVIRQATLTDTMTWNWIQAGMPIETVTIEAMHNIVAFSQFDNTIHLIITQHMNTSLTPGTGGQSFLNLFKLAGTGVGVAIVPPGNATFYAGDPEVLQLDVIREYLRIMLPNNLWFSKNVNNACPGCSPHTQTRHIPIFIQIRGEYEKAGLGALPWNPANQPGFVAARNLYALYNPHRYSAFPGKFSDAIFGGNNTSPAYDYNDTAAGLLCGVTAFHNASADNETVIPNGDDEMIPVFANPIYAAFGLGARRCPGEIFNQFVILELFKAVQCLNFYDDCTLNPTRCIPGSPDFKYGPIPLAPFKSAPDSLFVLNYTCPYPAQCA